MGIHDLLPFLRKNVPNAFIKYDDSIPRRAAVDIPIFMYKFGFCVGTGKALTERILSFGNELRSRNIEPVFVFDGGRLPEKEKEKERRNAVAQRGRQIFELKKSRLLFLGDIEIEVEDSCKPSCIPISEDYKAVHICLVEAGYDVKYAAFEGEALCSYLAYTHQVDFVITEDSDCLAYLCPHLLLHWGTEKEEYILFDTILAALNWTPDQFIDFCCLLGNDFNDRIYKMGPEKSKVLITRHTNLECIAEQGHDMNPMLISRNIFKSFCHEMIINKDGPAPA